MKLTESFPVQDWADTIHHLDFIADRMQEILDEVESLPYDISEYHEKYSEHLAWSIINNLLASNILRPLAEVNELLLEIRRKRG